MTLILRSVTGRYCLSFIALMVLFLSSTRPLWAEEASVAPPAEVWINQHFEIPFTGPDLKGDLLRIADSSGKILGGHYVYVAHQKNKIGKLSAPLEPGDYQVVYVSNKEVIASASLRVNAVTASVSAVASGVINATIPVQYQGPQNPGDTLQITTAAGDIVRGYYTYVGNAKGATLKLRLPSRAGNYSIAYVTGRKIIGSTPIAVTRVQATLEMAAKVAAGAHFTVRWQGPDNNGDFLQVLTEDGSKTPSYVYVAHNPETVTLRAPEEVGRYRVIYQTAGEIIGEVSFEVEDVTAQLMAPEEAEGNLQFNVSWDGPGNYGDTVVLVDPLTEALVAYKYVDKAHGKVAVFLAPGTPGYYELRYLTRGNRLLAARTIHITPAKLMPGSLRVVTEQRAALRAQDALEVVLDASGSMLQRQGGERRIDIAKRTLVGLINATVAEGTPFALRVFGHRETDKCRTDLELALAPLNRAKATAVLTGVTAMNLAKTPIADSLAKTAADLRGVTGERIIILVTDGEETCDGDPAAVIAGMRAASADVRVNIVGYAIDEAALRETFTRWANLGGGEYFDVSGEEGLAAALTSSVNPAFVVRDSQGVTVASGVAGGLPLELAAGDYQVTVGAQEYDVKVLPEQLSTVNLD